ncbi:uncharacterized protein LOC144365380 [Ictidomys tridecemlineatus]
MRPAQMVFGKLVVSLTSTGPSSGDGLSLLAPRHPLLASWGSAGTRGLRGAPGGAREPGGHRQDLGVGQIPLCELTPLPSRWHLRGQDVMPRRLTRGVGATVEECKPNPGHQSSLALPRVHTQAVNLEQPSFARVHTQAVNLEQPSFAPGAHTGCELGEAVGLPGLGLPSAEGLGLPWPPQAGRTSALPAGVSGWLTHHAWSRKGTHGLLRSSWGVEDVPWDLLFPSWERQRPWRLNSSPDTPGGFYGRGCPGPGRLPLPTPQQPCRGSAPTAGWRQRCLAWALFLSITSSPPTVGETVPRPQVSTPLRFPVPSGRNTRFVTRVRRGCPGSLFPGKTPIRPTEVHGLLV